MSKPGTVFCPILMNYIHSITEFNLIGELYEQVEVDYNLVRNALLDPKLGLCA
jgi:hypothetical protein